MVSGKLAAVAVVVVLLAAAVAGFAAMRPGTGPISTSGPTTTTKVASSGSSITQTTGFTTGATTDSSTMSSTTSASSTTGGTEFQKGATFSPAAYNSSGILAFFSKAPEAGQVLEWAGDWEDLGSNGAAASISQLASQYGMQMMVAVQFFQQSTGELIRPLNSMNEQTYLTLTKNFVQQYKPAFLGVGIEVNILYEKDRTSFQEFVSPYCRVYDEAKSVSPGTMVFTIFQLERMNGLDGGLYGGTNDPNNTEWQLLSLFKTDVAAFTTYPGLIYQNPSDVPSDYYSQLALHVNESVGFTEVGWHAGDVPGGWGSSEREQANFVSTFFTLTAGLTKTFVMWSFLYDQSAAVPFNTMGLFYTNGTAKLAWQTWQSEP